MTRYATAPAIVSQIAKQSRADRWEYDSLVPDLHVPEAVPVNTGLVDARGHAIMRLPPPIGFGRDREW